MAYLKSTTIGGKLNVVGTTTTNSVTMGSTTVNGIATSITSDATKLATAKAVYDYITANAGTMSSSANGKTVTTTVTKGGWFAKNTTSSASVGDASGFSLSITDKSSTNIGIGAVSGGYYPLTASLTGTFSASTAGWFTSSSATDSSVIVGRIAQSTVGSAVANTTDTAVLVLDPGKQTTISAGYYSSPRIIRASIADVAGEAINAGTVSFTGDDKSTTNVSIGTLSGSYYPVTASVSGSVKFASAGWVGTSGLAVTDTSVIVGRIAAASITLNDPTITPTHGAITPSIGGTVTSISTITTTQPTSGTDGTDYVTINPGAAIATQPKATPKYTYSATAGYSPGISSSTKTGSATNITPTINNGTNYYLPKQTPAFDGGGLSGGGLTVPNSSVTLAKGDTDGTGNITSSITDNGTTEPTSGYYIAVSGTAAAITASRAAVSRAAVKYNGGVNGWVNVADNTDALSSGSLASTTKSNTATTATEYFTIPTGGCTPSAALATLSSAGSSATSVTSRYFKVTPSTTHTAGYIAAGTLTGTVSNYTVRAASSWSLSVSSISGSSEVSVGTLSSGYYPIVASNLSVTATGTASTAGWSSSTDSITDSDTDSQTVGKIKAGSCSVSGGGLSGGGLSKGSGSVNASGTGITLGTKTTTQPTSGSYITVTGSGSVSRAAVSRAGVTVTHTAGYIPDQSATTVIAADSTTIGATSLSSNTATAYYPISTVTPAFDGGGLSGGGLTPSGSNLGTLSETNTSGISFTVSRAAVSRAAVLYNGAVSGLVNVADNTTALASATGLSSGSVTRYINDITLPASKTLNSFTFTAGSSSTYTTLTTLTGADCAKITTLKGSLTITNLANSASAGALYITTSGYSSTYKGTVKITTNTNGVVEVWGGGSVDKGVSVTNRVVTVDGGTAVTNSSGDLITTSRTASTGYVTLTAGSGSVSATGTNVTLGTKTTTKPSSGAYITVTGSGTVKGTGYGKVSTGTGWVTSGTTSSNTSSESSKTSNTATAYYSVTLPDTGPTIYTNAAKTTTTDQLTIYVDSSGNLVFKTA